MPQGTRCLEIGLQTACHVWQIFWSCWWWLFQEILQHLINAFIVSKKASRQYVQYFLSAISKKQHLIRTMIFCCMYLYIPAPSNGLCLNPTGCLMAPQLPSVWHPERRYLFLLILRSILISPSLASIWLGDRSNRFISFLVAGFSPTHLKHIISSNWTSSPKIGVNILKGIWNHHLPAPSKGCQLNPKGWWIDTL